jgi:hypothetical protein
MGGIRMNNFQLIDQAHRVEHLAVQLDAQPELWNRHSERKTAEGTPHAQMDDIWVRFRPREELTAPQRFVEPHFAAFYPAWDALPALRHHFPSLMHRVRAVYLGGILITKIPPGGRILPHHDRGGWHAEFHNCKVYVPIKSNLAVRQSLRGETVIMQAGEAWTFDNLKVHSVENNGTTDRITAIICMRVE